MKSLVTFLVLFFLGTAVVSNSTNIESEVAKVHVLHINAKWNKNNNVNLSDLTRCTIDYAYYEDQPADVQKSIIRVPTIIVTKQKRPVAQWIADLSFKIDVEPKEIQEVINKALDDK